MNEAFYLEVFDKDNQPVDIQHVAYAPNYYFGVSEWEKDSNVERKKIMMEFDVNTNEHYMYLYNNDGKFNQIGTDKKIVLKVSKVEVNAKNDLKFTVLTEDKKTQVIEIRHDGIIATQDTQKVYIPMRNNLIYLPGNFFQLVEENKIEAKELPSQMFDAHAASDNNSKLKTPGHNQHRRDKWINIPYKNKEIKMIRFDRNAPDATGRKGDDSNKIFIVNGNKLVQFDARNVYAYSQENKNFIGIALSDKKGLSLRDLSDEDYKKIINFIAEDHPEKITMLSKVEFAKQIVYPKRLTKQSPSIKKIGSIQEKANENADQAEPTPEDAPTQPKNNGPEIITPDNGPKGPKPSPTPPRHDNAYATPKEDEEEKSFFTFDDENNFVDSGSTGGEEEQTDPNVDTPVDTAQGSQDGSEDNGSQNGSQDSSTEQKFAQTGEEKSDNNGDDNKGNKENKTTEQTNGTEQKETTQGATAATAKAATDADKADKKEKPKEEKKEEKKDAKSAVKEVKVELNNIFKVFGVALFLFGFFTGIGGLLLPVIAMGIGSTGFAFNTKFGYTPGKLDLTKKSTIEKERKDIDQAVEKGQANYGAAEKTKQALEQYKDSIGFFDQVKQEIDSAIVLLEKTISNNQIKLDKAKNGNINSNKLEKFAERQEFLKEQLNNIILEKMKFEQFVANVKTDLEEAIEHAGKYLNLLQQEEQLPKEIEAEIEKLNQEDIVLHQKHSEKIEQITAAEEVKEPSEEEIKKLNQEKEIIATRRDKIKENLVILNQQLQEKQKIKQEKKFIEDNYLANKVLNDKIKDVHEKSKQISENIKKITNKKVKTEEKHKGKDKSKDKKPSQEQTL